MQFTCFVIEPDEKDEGKDRLASSRDFSSPRNRSNRSHNARPFRGGRTGGRGGHSSGRSRGNGQSRSFYQNNDTNAAAAGRSYKTNTIFGDKRGMTPCYYVNIIYLV